MTYDPRTAVIHSASAQLTALTGAEIRVTDEGGSVRVEAPVTDALLRHWTAAVSVFYLGSEFGLSDTEAGQFVWIRFDLGKGTRP
ncbi:hypothetical protein [Streptomyces sp. NPDC037389]|uniref:hypothetical protein n=1 Tax=Streptomyces sp. NPDC037389 TaxID=3155369 RepID=UPI0033DABEDC